MDLEANAGEESEIDEDGKAQDESEESVESKRKDAIRRWEVLKVEELKVELGKRNLPKQGSKKDLVMKLVEHAHPRTWMNMYVRGRNPQELQEQVGAADGEERGSAQPEEHQEDAQPEEHQEDAQPDERERARQEWKKLPVKDSLRLGAGLLTACFDRGLNDKGTKTQLIERLIEFEFAGKDHGDEHTRAGESGEGHALSGAG
eukprot:3036392-Rhodomonas_salina.2